MAAQLPNGSILLMAATYATPVTITAISNALPAVATATNTYAVGDIIEVNSGWTALNGRAVRVSAATGTSFTLEGIDTTDTTRYTAGGGAGTSRKVMTKIEITQITDTASTGGEQQFATYGFLAESDDRQIPTTKNPISNTYTVADDPTQAFFAFVEAADQDRKPRILQLILANGSSILQNSYVSVTGTPTTNRNNIMTRVITASQISRLTRYAS